MGPFGSAGSNVGRATLGRENFAIVIVAPRAGARAGAKAAHRPARLSRRSVRAIGIKEILVEI